MQNAIEIDALCKRYGQIDAIQGINASIPHGQVIGLLGHNGAGKSTLIKLILGLITPSSGRLSVLGETPWGPRAHVLRQQLGYLPESVAFYGNLTGGEVIDYLAQLKNAPLHQGRQLLERVGLRHAISRRISGYSKGMRQRLGLAQALLNRPQIVLLDEPTGGLDPQATRELYTIVDELRAAGCCVLISSHVLAELEPHIDGALVLREGRLLAAGSVTELRKQAGLPSIISLRLTREGDTQGLLQSLAKVNAKYEINASDQIEIQIREPDKLALLREILKYPVIENIETREPTLARLYDWLSVSMQESEEAA
ncbi:MAG: ABC transporter ATP-binding protein [Castellaniella sp.]|uniref:ABC transporter ATP-binding protein n=1 Tax=Castellaniella sp. TaxID=1955812 RepID=UPI0012207604|nr:ABC transporter ATP-binding protein [Castellaniella sp.]TAN25117.1 MAG: ABC transporter ATP-binding protein [Castellaniella sp.]